MPCGMPAEIRSVEAALWDSTNDLDTVLDTRNRLIISNELSSYINFAQVVIDP